MFLVDAQVHIWAASTPERPWRAGQHPHREKPLGADELLREMDGAGVRRAVLIPPYWDGPRNDVVLEAARLHPDRFAVMGRLDNEPPPTRDQIPTWRRQPGMLGLRCSFSRPQVPARRLNVVTFQRGFGGGDSMKRLLKGLIVVIAFAAPLVFAAEDYPVRPIRFIVPMPPGGALDVAARIVGTKLTEILGQPIVIDNRSGAQGNIATALGAKAAPDGYTMTLGFAGSLAINPHLYSNPGYATFKDFAAVSRTIEIPYILIVNPSVPVKTMKDLELLAKQNPGKLTFASGSSTSQLAGELFKLTTGANIVHVPYSGGAPASIALVAGEVNTIFSLAPAMLPFVQAGKLRAVTVLSDKRIEVLPDVPTAVEAGYPELSHV